MTLSHFFILLAVVWLTPSMTTKARLALAVLSLALAVVFFTISKGIL